MSDVTKLTQRIAEGDEDAAGQLLPIVYAELRRLAEARMHYEKSDHSLQPTALVHEAYVSGRPKPATEGRVKTGH